MLRLGLVQLLVTEGQTEKNISRIRALTEKYASEDIDLLCFPELCISGYDFEKAKYSSDEESFFSSLAKENHLAVMAGIKIVRDERPYDAACIWDESGKLLGEYKKIHLWDKESEFFKGGDELSVIPFRGWKIGLLICADMRFFEVSTPLKHMGADIIIYPSAWAYGYLELFHLCCRMRAAENQIYTVALNRASGDVKYCGGRAAAGPDGELLCALPDDKEGFIKVQAKKAQIRKVQEGLAWESMKLPHIYKKYEQYRFAGK